MVLLIAALGLANLLPAVSGLSVLAYGCFMLLALSALLLTSSEPLKPAFKWPGLLFATIVVLTGFCMIIQQLTGLPIDPRCQMSVTNALLLTLSGIAVFLVRGKQSAWMHEALVGLPLAVAFLNIIFYFFALQLEPGSTFLHIGPIAAIMFAFTSLAVIFARADGAIVSTLISDETGGVLARKLMPIGIALPILIGWLSVQSEKLGLYGQWTSIATIIVGFVIFICLVVMIAARWLNGMDVRRKAAEVALRISELKNRSVLEQTQEAFISVNSRCEVLEWNKQAEATFGWTRHEAIGRKIYELIIPFDLKETYEAGISRYLETGKSDFLQRRIEMPGLKKDGSEVPLELSVTPIQLGEEVIFSSFIRDISDRKSMERRLNEARDEAIEASRLKSHFLATMSHEIRTPMNAVIGMSELLCNTSLTPEQKDFVTIIQNSSEVLLDLINNILDYSKLEAGRLTLESVDFEMVNVIEGTGDLLASESRKKGLSLMTFVHPAVPNVVRGDPGRIRQVLINLISNAIKFTSRGEILVRVELEAENLLDSKIRFEVKDTGMGFDISRLPELFEPFRQVDVSMSRRFGGTGLGLSISKKLVELMNGEIGAKSIPGEGSLFWFTIALQPVASETPVQTPEQLVGARLLIVDGPAGSEQVLSDYATSWGMEVDIAPGAEEALVKLRQAKAAGNPFTSVLVDVESQTPFVFAKRLKAELHDLAPALVLIGPTDDQSILSEAKNSGYAECLVKPVRQSRLYNTLVEVLGFESQMLTGLEQIVDTETIDERSDSSLVLVVEDNSVNQKVALMQLRSLGVAAHAVASGSEALKAISRTRYALILMDCEMPDMDGFETTLEIRRLEGASGNHTPIVAMTARAMTEDRAKCLAAGMDDYMSKPVNQKKLQQMLYKWIPEYETNPVLNENNEPQTSPTPTPHTSSSKFSDSQASKLLPSKPQNPKPPRRETPPIDLGLLKDTYGEAGLQEIIRTFIESTHEELRLATEHVQNRNLRALKDIIHSIKGASSAAFAVEMARLSRHVEEEIAFEEWGRIEAAFERLMLTFEDVISYLAGTSFSPIFKHQPGNQQPLANKVV